MFRFSLTQFMTHDVRMCAIGIIASLIPIFVLNHNSPVLHAAQNFSRVDVQAGCFNLSGFPIDAAFRNLCLQFEYISD